MPVRFDRTLISSINNARPINVNKYKSAAESNKRSVPEKETFKHILNKACEGNEMAAVLLDDWHKSCEPKNDREQQVYNMINKAVNRIFK